MSEASEAIDDQVLHLRGKGQAYARISRDLGFERTADAQQAFRRALRRLPTIDATRVRSEELSRLDRLAERVRADTSRNELDRTRQMKTIERMKEQVRDETGAAGGGSS